jgi:hypothetical protein
MKQHIVIIGMGQLASVFARVFLEVLKVQEMLVDKHLPLERLLARFTAALNSDPEHTCRGRAAPDRLARLLALAEKAKIPVPTLRSIGADQVL